MIRVAVVDHGMGNLRSVARAVEAAGAQPIVTSIASEMETCDALCVPGQGIFGRCVTNLRNTRLDALMVEWIAAGRPYLGICLGMQVLFDSSEESSLPGLSVLRGTVARLPDTVTVPHIGWNKVSGLSEEFYFDHSFAVEPEDPSIVTGWCEHGRTFAALISTGPILAAQFHPEKSGRAGIELLTEWVSRVNEFTRESDRLDDRVEK